MKHKIKIISVLFSIFVIAGCDNTGSITYDCNKCTGGTIPKDTKTYNSSDTLTVLGNPGKLVKIDAVFAGWSTNPMGLGKIYQEGDTFQMGFENVTLYSKWTETGQCMVKNCFFEVTSCAVDKTCREWLGCMQNCGDDKMLCPTICGAFYQSPKISDLSVCGFENDCISIDFSHLP